MLPLPAGIPHQDHEHITGTLLQMKETPLPVGTGQGRIGFWADRNAFLFTRETFREMRRLKKETDPARILRLSGEGVQTDLLRHGRPAGGHAMKQRTVPRKGGSVCLLQLRFAATRSPCSLKRTLRTSLPVALMISVKRTSSVTEEIRENATPWRRARPVRPMRWM